MSSGRHLLILRSLQMVTATTMVRVMTTVVIGTVMSCIICQLSIVGLIIITVVVADWLGLDTVAIGT